MERQSHRWPLEEKIRNSLWKPNQPLRPIGMSFSTASAAQVSVNAWQTWLEPLTAQLSAAAVLTLHAPSQFHLRWVQDHFLRCDPSRAAKATCSVRSVGRRARESTRSRGFQTDGPARSTAGTCISPPSPSQFRAPVQDRDSRLIAKVHVRQLCCRTRRTVLPTPRQWPLPSKPGLALQPTLHLWPRRFG